MRSWAGGWSGRSTRCGRSVGSTAHERAAGAGGLRLQRLLQALINPRGPSGGCLTAAFEGRVALFCSERTIEEVWEAASRAPVRARFRSLTDERLSLLAESIERVATFVAPVPEVFALARDPDDAHYINLALAAGASLVVSRDRDLLDLRNRATPEGRDFAARFPGLSILEPPELLRRLGPPPAPAS